MPPRTGQADPARRMALLWRTLPGPARGPRPGLDLEQIIVTATAIADTDGLPALSMRRVAQELGVGTMSLYTYVPSREDLLALLVDAAYGEMARPPHTPGRWRDNLRRVADAHWEHYQRHPWLLEVSTVRPGLGPHEIARYDHELRAMTGAGLDDIELDATLTVILAHVRAAAGRALAQTRTAQATGQSEAEWWAVHGPLLAEVLDPEEYPLAVRVGAAAGSAHGAADDPRHSLEYGLERILDGVEVLVTGRR